MKDAVGDTRERIVMFQTEPLLAAIQADRSREFHRIARERQLLNQPETTEAARSAVHDAGRSRPVVRRTTGSSGPACEAL